LVLVDQCLATLPHLEEYISGVNGGHLYLLVCKVPIQGSQNYEPQVVHRPHHTKGALTNIWMHRLLEYYKIQNV
jgi:hypothetical protein